MNRKRQQARAAKKSRRTERRSNKQRGHEHLDGGFERNPYTPTKLTSGFKPVKLSGRTPNQVNYIYTIRDNDITLAHGPAGSGKTHIAVGMAVKMLKEGQIEKIKISRPVVDVGSGIGFLPGKVEDKVGPYLIPLFDELSVYCEQSLIKKWMAEGTLEITPLSMMRGRTFKNAFVILDEAQNALMPELRMLLTRIGMNCKMVLTGDMHQSDLPGQARGAFQKVVNRLTGLEGIGVSALDASDIVRHRLIADIETRLAN